MKIKRVECDQFAGLLGKELEFEKGLNLIVGENESGKSTIADLIFQMLFQDIKLDGRSGSNSDFIDKYFPKVVSGPEGDSIDGTLVFETENGKYKLKKEWEKGSGRCKLTLPSGISIVNPEQIAKEMGEILPYGKGVFSEIVFASQKRVQLAVESIMKALGKQDKSLSDAREAFASTLTKAALETGGVSISKLEEKLQIKLRALDGHWDFAADAPDGGPSRARAKNAWKKELGEITKAYYEVDKVREALQDAEKAERTVEERKSAIRCLQERKDHAIAKREAFQSYRTILGQRVSLEKLIQKCREEIEEKEKAMADWPIAFNRKKEAEGLRTALEQAETRECFNRAKAAYTVYCEKEAELTSLREVDMSDIRLLRKLLDEKRKEESKLSGMNLAAKIKKLGEAQIQITKTSTGEVLSVEDGEIRITEAVKILVPGVLEMDLMPKGIDAEAVAKEINRLEEEIKRIYVKYGIGSLEELTTMADRYDLVKKEKEQSKLALEKALGDKVWEDLEAKNSALPEQMESVEVVKNKLRTLCGGKTPDGFIGGLEEKMQGYRDKYDSVEKLSADVVSQKLELEKMGDQLNALGEIPDEYRDISDPDQYDTVLKNAVSKVEEDIKEQDDELRAAERELGEKSAEEYAEELKEKEEILAAKKAEYKHWKNIQRTFLQLKEKSVGNPVQDIEDKFKEYMSVITDGILRLEAMDEKMSVRLSSGTHALTYDILSEGTKDTISLAFRLAMLEHLYPEGDGLAVFDDSFTDMDPKRRVEACRLISKFAEKNQVIFITCDEKYLEYLQGNVVRIG